MHRKGDTMISQAISDAISEYVKSIPSQHEINFILNTGFGDYASNIAFLIAKESNKPALDFAYDLAKKLSSKAIFKKVEVAGKGFINFTLAEKFLWQELKKAKDVNFGKVDIGRQQKVLVEYISANPTGPLNVVQARAGAFGNALVNLLRFVNYQAFSEYYINNTGQQIDLLYESFLARIRTLMGKPTELPEHGYPGSYLIEIAQQFIKENIPQANWRSKLLETIINQQKSSLQKFGIHFDYFAEESNYVALREVVLERLKDYCYQKDGALWFRASQFNDSEDRVLITANGRATYFLSDLAYHWVKFKRGFDILINIWGPDHHGYIQRMKGGIKGLGFDAERLIVIIAQQVSLLRNKEKIVMSKRAGEFITLDEVMAEIGADALKFFLLMRRASQHLEFDLALAQKTSQENPVYYVQYAHARINSIVRNAMNIKELNEDNVDLSVLTNDSEQLLIKVILHFPDVLAASARHFEPHHLVYYLLQLANAFHNFYEKVRVITDEPQLFQARIFLCQCTQQVIRQGLNILGITAPEKM